MAEKHGVKMKKPGEVTLESEFEKIKTVRITRYTAHQRTQFGIATIYDINFVHMSVFAITAFEIFLFCCHKFLAMSIQLQK
jgi:hypothetical protein